MYCKNCKKHTGNTFPKKIVFISKNKINRKSKCAIWLTERNFIHKIEDKYGLENELEIYLQLRSLRFWENKGWINKIDPYGLFQWYFRDWLGRRSKDDKRQISRWKKIVSRFKDKLVKMISDAGSKFDDYSISPKIRQILLLWHCELTEKDFLMS